MKFSKLHGAGNDFILIDIRGLSLSPAWLSELAARLCPRRTSVGADGLIALTETAEPGLDFAMLFFNSDGSPGEMCGNGARCIARFAYELGAAGEKMRFGTTAGPVSAERLSRDEYRVFLNPPTVIETDISAAGRHCSYVELGKPGLPHAVVFLGDEEALDKEALRPLALALRYEKRFPKGANVSFAKRLPEGVFEAVTYERGVEDYTLACGTGCGAVACAAVLGGLCAPEDEIKIRMPGGRLSLLPRVENGKVTSLRLTGPVCRVYDAELPPPYEF